VDVLMSTCPCCCSKVFLMRPPKVTDWLPLVTRFHLNPNQWVPLSNGEFNPGEQFQGPWQLKSKAHSPTELLEWGSLRKWPSPRFNKITWDSSNLGGFLTTFGPQKAMFSTGRFMDLPNLLGQTTLDLPIFQRVLPRSSVASFSLWLPS